MVRACPGAWFAGGRGWWLDGDCGSEARQNKCRVAPGSAEALAVDPPRLGRAYWALCELEYKERVWPEDPRTRVLEELRWELVQAEHQQWRCRGLWKPDTLVGNKGEECPSLPPFSSVPADALWTVILLSQLALQRVLLKDPLGTMASGHFRWEELNSTSALAPRTVEEGWQVPERFLNELSVTYFTPECRGLGDSAVGLFVQILPPPTLALSKQKTLVSCSFTGYRCSVRQPSVGARCCTKQTW